MAPEEQGDHFNRDLLNVDVDEGSNDDAFSLKSEESGHHSQGDNSQNEDQEEFGLNIMESDGDEDDDNFDNNDDVYITDLRCQQRD